MAEPVAARQRRDMPTEPANLPLISEGQTTELVIHDRFEVSPQERVDWGIQDHHALHYVRDPEIHKKTEMVDRVREFKNHHPGAEVVRNERNEIVTNGDLVLMKYSQAQKEAIEARDRQRAEEWMGEIEEQRHPDHFDRRRISREDLEAKHAENYRAHRESRLIGGPTQGFKLADAEALYTREQTLATEAACRRGPRHTQTDDEAWRNTIDAYEDKRTGGKATFGGFSKSGFTGTTPTAQARAKAKSGAAAR